MDGITFRGGDRASAGARGALSDASSDRRRADALASSRHGGSACCRRGPDESQLPDPVRRRTALERGRRAGASLRDQFNWDNHAWVRYRSFLAALEVNLGQFGHAYEHPAPQDESIWETIRGEPGAPPAPGYAWSSGKQAAFAHDMNATLVSMASAVGPSPKTVAGGAPRPEPELRLTSKT
jgi:hypothetical protein